VTDGAAALAFPEIRGVGAPLELPDELDARGAAVLPGLLAPEECAALIGCYDQADLFRRRILMQRHGFGHGEYQYFRYPLPPLVEALRARLYELLVPVANRWRSAMAQPTHYPARLAAFLQQCHAAGQRQPTPLLLRYAAGDYNCLHQDLYGEHVFPLQATVLLSIPGTDFEGGEFVLTEQRPRAQSRAEVVPLQQGDAVVFAVHHRPVQGRRGFHRVNLRHGVSRVRCGMRYTLGVVFHDAR
jgi:hypothetical protein